MNDDAFIRRYHVMGKTPEWIARKTGLPVATIVKAIALFTLTDQTEAGPMPALEEQFSILCHQYQLLGESLKKLATLFNAPFSAAELIEIVGDEKIAARLLREAIVLKPLSKSQEADILTAT